MEAFNEMFYFLYFGCENSLLYESWAFTVNLLLRLKYFHLNVQENPEKMQQKTN